MPINNFDPDWFLLSLAWRDLTPWQRLCIIQRARLYMLERRARRVWVIAKAEAAGVAWLVPVPAGAVSAFVALLLGGV